MDEFKGLGMDFAQPSSKRRKPKKNKVFKTVVLVNLILISLIVAIGLLTPAFYIREITVTGVSHLTPDKVIDASNLEVGKNIFTFRTDRVEESISLLSFVKEAKVSRQYPNKVSIVVTECKPLSQVVCGESLFIVVDDDGKILDTTSERAKYGIPVIEGVEVEQFEVGNIINTQKTDTFETLLQLSKELSENNMVDMVDKLSWEKGTFYFTFRNGVVCDLGNGTNISYKIRFVKEVMNRIPAGKTGTLEFIDEYKAVFKEHE